MSEATNPGRPSCGRGATSYDVRVWAVKPYERKRGKTYGVRWSVAGEAKHQTFRTRALADAFRAGLLSATKQGQPFDVATGLPVTALPVATAPSWFDFASAFAEAKWNRAAPRSRESIADALAAVTPALIVSDRGSPAPSILRPALSGWAFNAGRIRAGVVPPDEFSRALAWIAENTLTLDAIDDVGTARRMLDSLAVLLDGTPAAATTVSRRRAVLHNALQHGVEIGYFSANPLNKFKWKAPKVAEAVDRRSVVNHDQARALLTAVALTSRPACRLVGFFACMYYAGLRPGEVTELRECDLTLPERGWGELNLCFSNPATGTSWTDHGKRERRQLKHRAKKDTRIVPAPALLVEILRTHIEEFGTAPDGRLFRGTRGGAMPDSTYCRVWQDARRIALTPAEAESPLAARPYDLRHAAVSTWLNAGVDPTQVAEWAGHSVAVLMRVYAKCIVGRDGIARRRIADALGEPESEE